MNISARFIIMTALSFLTMQSFAQAPLESLRTMFSTSAVSIDAEYQMTVQQMPVTGTSHVLVQGDKYHMKGNGLEVLCNGDAVWTVDESSKEVVIEPCDEHYDIYIGNPVLLFADLDTFFETEGHSNIGRYTNYRFNAIKDCGISHAQLVLSSEGYVISGEFHLQDGTLMTVEVISMKKTEERDPSFFSLSRKLGPDWIVTDLR